MSNGPAGTEPIEAAAAITPDFLGGQKLEDGIGLCLSGGGFRAMLFHLGAFIRLNELGLLRKLDRSPAFREDRSPQARLPWRGMT